MPDLKPIRRHQALVALTKDHHSGLLMVWKLRQGLMKNVGTVRVANYASHFYRTELIPHFRLEERYLFTLLDPDDELRVRAEGEHNVISMLAEAIGKTRNNRQLLNMFADELERHIRFEERVLFNHLQHVSTEALVGVAGKINGHEVHCELAWQDEFWLN